MHLVSVKLTRVEQKLFPGQDVTIIKVKGQSQGHSDLIRGLDTPPFNMNQHIKCDNPK